LAAYAARRQERATAVVRVRARPVWSLKDAHAMRRGWLAAWPDWMPLSGILSSYHTAPDMRRSVTASTFGASLELVRAGTIELRQAEPFAPLYIRDRGHGAPSLTEP